MIRHLFKLAWNRRRANGLVMFELLLAFLVLCGVLTLTCDGLLNWMKPLGFDYADVWRMDVRHSLSVRINEEGASEIWPVLEQLRLLMRDLEEVEAFSPLEANVPFGGSTYGSYYLIDGSPQQFLHCEVLPEAMDVLRLDLLAGRWLQPGDESMNWQPTVITRDLAVALFGGEDPVGQPLSFVEDDEEKEWRVVGVVADYRKWGETQAGRFTFFVPVRWGSGIWPPSNYIFRLLPGTPAAFEEELLRAVRGVVPGWTVNVSRLAIHRSRVLRQAMTVILISATVAGFLILMVGLGLTGVLWQSVTRRTEEMGIRRAMGAKAAHVRWQILGELLALTTMAAGIGSLIFLQLPALQVFGWIPLHVYLLALILALLVLFTFVTVCGIYPAWLATRVRPAEALQHE
jgi:putative ABC transport system permease protein